MRLALKPLAEQVMVITGASSGIGLATARRAATCGARVVLAARNGDELNEIAAAIRTSGGRAEWLAIDMAGNEAGERLARFAEEKFGGFDCWVNNAAAGLLAPLDEVTAAEHRRVFDVGYFGYVAASLAAVARLRTRGGALINVGSVLSDRAVPIQGPYAAMKAAVQSFTDSLRMELEMAGAPVSVTLIKPSSIDTPYIEHARSKLDAPSTPPPPPSILYDPELVAKAICFAAEHPRRSLTVGGAGMLMTALAPFQPRLTDLFLERLLAPEMQTGDEPPAPGTNDNLFAPREDGRERSNQRRAPRRQSLYLDAQMYPGKAAAIVGGLTALIGAGAWAIKRRD